LQARLPPIRRLAPDTSLNKPSSIAVRVMLARLQGRYADAGGAPVQE
jgi:hypothetical protein